ncbi:MAG: right-handed parallel beta-helix repeat-containing protein [Actinobacteria bacterium]|nr:MAG: right-handed parallel beta-helix repeat-containing protein [Actinomycetota bacterium]
MSKRFSQASGGFAWVLAMAACLCSISATSPAVARAAGSNRIEFWVSARGSDRAAGSQSHPFRTLAKARDAVRAARRSDGRAKISVYLLAGTYRLTRPLVLDWRDSGRAGAAVVWRAAPGAHPVISGAVRVQGWTLHDATRGIYEARVVRGLQTRQLYVDGSRALRARSGIYPPGFTRTPSGFRAPSDSMASWRNLSSIEAVTRTQWKMMRCPVRSIRGRDIVMRQPCWTNVNVFPYLWSFQTLTWLENAYELLDRPGEWYLDSRAGRLYYIPRHGQRLARADIELPILQALIEVRGTVHRPVKHIRFQGLTFAYGTWLDPSSPNGYADDQSGFHLDGRGHRTNLIGHDPDTTRTPGNVRLRYARHVMFTHDDFLHLGGVGLDFDTGSQHDAVVGNRFDDISSAATELGGVSPVDHHPAHRGQVTLDNTISNNLITNIGREYQDAAGVYVGFTTRSRVEHNDIRNVPWSGIAIGWGWGLLDPTGFLGLPAAVPGQWGSYRKPTTSAGNELVDNRITVAAM